MIQDTLQELYTRYIEKNKKAAISIGAAVTLTLLVEYAYKKLTVPPKKYKGIPCLTYVDLIKDAFNGETVYSQKKKLVLPLLKKGNGVYMTPTQLGWMLRSANPAVNKALLSDDVLFPKAPSMFGEGNNLMSRFVGGPNLGSRNGEDWRRHKKVMNPAFHRALPVQTFGFLSERTFDYLEDNGLDNVEVINLCERMTLDAIGLAGFGFDFECSKIKDNQWLNNYETIRENMSKVFFVIFQIFDDQLKWLFPSRVDAHKKLDVLLDKIDGMIESRRAEVFNDMKTPEYQNKPTAEKDVMTLMLEAEHEGEGKMSNEELRANIIGFFFAGNDTTAVSLSCVLAQLARFPEIQRLAREEANAILGYGPESVKPTADQCREMKYIDAIIKETLRLYSPISNTLPRVASRDAVVEGIFIPKGTYVDVDTVATHMYEKNWPNASEFDPTRFLNPEDSTSTKEGVSYVTFGYGSRYCIGYNFTLYEQRIFLSMLLRRFEWELPKDSIHKDELAIDGYGILRPVDLKINFKKIQY